VVSLIRPPTNPQRDDSCASTIHTALTKLSWRSFIPTFRWLSSWVRRYLLILFVGTSGYASVGAVTAFDISQPEFSGMSPSEMGAWFYSPTNVVQASGEQVALIWQLCSSCRAVIDQTGGDNYAMIYQNDDDTTASVTQGGNSHAVIVQSGPSMATIHQTPGAEGNVAFISQSSGPGSVANWR
jgi:hypothetical protein